MNEESILKSVLPFLKQGPEVIVPPGDDCAVIDVGLDDRYQLQAVDQVIAERHYLKNSTSPADIARKLLKRNISDIAAMGGVPTQALLTIAINESNPEWFVEFFRGLGEEAEKWGISVCGGDLASMESEQEVCTLSIMGWVPKERLCLRSNACDGDVICCTGRLGNSFESNHHITFTPHLEAAQFIAGTYSTAMMDISDGVHVDIKRMMQLSELGAVIDIDALPLRKDADTKSALTEGEDYGLLFAVPESLIDDMLIKWPFKDLEVNKIGLFTNQDFSLVYTSRESGNIDLRLSGFDHFRCM